MARPKNTERKEKIKHTAWNLFRRKGYRGTSYADVAAACGLERTNVQIYFPHKKLLLEDLLKQLLDVSAQYAKEAGLLEESFSGNLLVIGQLYYAFLLQDDGMCRFTQDLLSSRELTEGMIEDNLSWAAAYYRNFPQNAAESLMEDITLVMGGVYELLYRSLDRGNRPTPWAIQSRTIHAFLLLQGMPEEAAVQTLKGHEVPEEQTIRAVRQMNAKIFSPAT
ncbi:MAG: TetR/AcrR family transcriptional regulator [Acutalibacteraceae bacterium]